LRGNFVVAAHLFVRLTPQFLRALHGRGEPRSPEHGLPAGRPYKRNHPSGGFLRDHKFLNHPFPILVGILKKIVKFCQLKGLITSQKIVPPVETGVQIICIYLKNLDSGARPRPDPGSTKMTETLNFRLFVKSAGSV